MNNFNFYKLSLFFCIFIYSELYPKRPSWIETPYKIYDTNHYEVVIGEGENYNSAVSSAYANLSRRFNIFVSSETTSRETIKESSIDVVSSETTSQETIKSSTIDIELVDNIRLTSSQEFSHTSIDRQYYSSLNNQYYVLLSLDKKKYSKNLKSRIDKNNSIFKSCQWSTDPLKNFKQLLYTRPLALSNELYIEQLRYFGIGYTRSLLSSVDLTQELKKQQEMLTLRFDDSIPRKFENSIITGLGIFYTALESTYRATGSYSTKNTARTFGIDLVVHSLIINIVDKNGTVVFSCAVESKGLSADLNSVLKDLSMKISHKFTEYLHTTI